MINNADANAELHARVSDALLTIKFSNVLSDADLHALAYACGVQIPAGMPTWETREQKQRRMVREATNAE